MAQNPPAPQNAQADPAAAAAAAQAAQDLQDEQDGLFDDQQFLQEMFWRYRIGDDSYMKSLDDVELEYWVGRKHHLRAIRARQVPRVNYRRMGREAQRVLNEPLADLNRTFYPPPAANGIAFNLPANKRDVTLLEFRRAAELMTARRSFTFVKVLGAGGNGVVVLWRWTPGGNLRGDGHYVVMKFSCNLDEDGNVDWQDIDDEKKVMSELVRAPHTTQLFYFADNLSANPRTRIAGAQRQAADNLDNAKGMLPMEFAKLGNMEGWIKQLVGANRDLSPQALWRIFDCLVKACRAMAFPPYLRSPGPRTGAFLPEDIPNNAPGIPGAVPPQNQRQGFMGYVHFDLDPTNIFVNGYDQAGAQNPMNPDHTQMPRFQIADYGLARTATHLWRRSAVAGFSQLTIARRRRHVWNWRLMAKRGWYLPEQFTQEWDQFVGGPDEVQWPRWNRWTEPSGPGRYTSLSNIWDVGMTMFCLLLHQRPDFPPVAGRMLSAEPPRDPMPQRLQRWTYGYRLIADSEEGEEYRHRFTPRLCETIARCLMARQDHRPDLVTLQHTIDLALGNPPAQPPDNVRQFFGDDVPPPLPWYSTYFDHDLLHMDPFDPYAAYANLTPPAATPRPRRRGRRTRLAPEDRAYRP